MHTRYSKHRHKIQKTHTLQHPKIQISKKTLAETLVSYFKK